MFFIAIVIVIVIVGMQKALELLIIHFVLADCNLSREDLELKVMEKLGNLLMMPAEEIDQSQPMVHYGVDSLISLDVTNWMRKEFNLQVNQMDILEGMTTETLIEQALG